MNELEEDIFIVESFLKNKKMLLKHPCWVSEKTIQAIEKLINKNKELRQEVAEYERRETQQNKNMVSVLEESLKYCLEIKDLDMKNKEQEKIIKLMAKDISENDFNEDICRQLRDPKKEECYAYIHDKNACFDYVIEYFKKKARE